MANNFSKIHPQLQPAAKKYPKFPFNQRTLWLFKLLTALMPAPKTPVDLHIENVFIPGPDERSKIRLRIYQPVSAPAPRPALLWLHGGGYVIGKPEIDESCCTLYAREAGITVVSVDYRLAPKHPSPAALDDSYAALKWVADQARQLGVDKQRIAVGGESAGGGLAAALAQLAHDRREIQPVFQLLVYPMLDDRTALRAEIDDSQNVTWSLQSNRFGWEAYLGQECGGPEAPAYAVPARREDLSGLPPAWIGVGDLDLFHDEDVAYAQRLRDSGVACEQQVVPGAFHGFDVLAPQAPLVRDFRQTQVRALRRVLFP
jgi:acetyl esterase/lipase